MLDLGRPSFWSTPECRKFDQLDINALSWTLLIASPRQDFLHKSLVTVDNPSKRKLPAFR